MAYLYCRVACIVLAGLVFQCRAQNNTAPSNDTVTLSPSPTAAGVKNQCYDCSSFKFDDPEDSPCYNPEKHPGKIATVDCEGPCFKYNQELDLKYKRVNRGCSIELEPTIAKRGEKEGCMFTTGTKLVQLEICNCNGNLCNGATSVASSVLAVGVLGLLTAVLS